MYTTLPMEKIIKALFPNDDVKYEPRKVAGSICSLPRAMLMTAQEELGTEDPAQDGRS
jgi:hypothetical protein